jgi:probable HAF family extracellular repeat protein
MKRNIGPALVVIALMGLPTLAEAQKVSAPLPHYTVMNLGTLGGSQSNGYAGVTNNGWVAGDSFLGRVGREPADATEHAFVWRDGVMTDLGTLGGLNSGAAYPIKDNHGLIVGQAQGFQVDPKGESWGQAYGCIIQGTPAACDGWENVQLGYLWQNGVMTELPPIGGNNSSAFGVNNRGQVVGLAETATPDSSCVLPQVLDYKAVVYGPKRGEVHELPTFPGDAVAGATAINDNGDVVGFSGSCVVPTFPSGVHAVLWRNGSVFDLGGLGGVLNNAANAINNAGQIAGQSDLPGDTITHAALWQTGTRPTDVGTLPGGEGDVFIVANDINARGQVVGASCDASFNCRAWLWDNGVIIDLNSLIPPGSPLYLTWGGGINDLGEIAGSAVLKSNPNEAPAFLAIPAPAAQIAGDSARKMVLPEAVRASLQRRLRLRHPGDRATAQQ